MNRTALSFALVLVLVGSAAAQNSNIEEARRKLRTSRRGDGRRGDGRRGEASAHEGHKLAETAAPVATGDSATEHLQIGIEYRGAIKKTDNNIGTAVMRCRTTGPDSFEVTFNGHARVPGKKKEAPIDFEVVRAFKLEGTVVKNVGGSEKFSSTAEKYKLKILNMLAVAYLIKFRSPIYSEDQPQSMTWEVDARRFQFSYTKLGRPGALREVQVSLNELTDNNRFLGKFFLSPSASAPSPFRKFRIQTRDQLGINFVTI